jgi:hypothetical protein
MQIFTEQECQVEMQKITNPKDKKSLGYLLIFIRDRWIEEQHYEPFEDYVKYVKNVLRKYTPKRTKFVRLTQNPFALTIRIPQFPYDCEITIITNKTIWKPIKRS